MSILSPKVSTYFLIIPSLSLSLTSTPLPIASMFASQDSIYDFFWPCPTPAPQICSSKLMALAPITPMLVAPCPSLSQCPGCPPVYPVGRTKTACFQLVLLAPSSDLSILGLWMSSYSITMHHPAPQARDLGVISAFLHPPPHTQSPHFTYSVPEMVPKPTVSLLSSCYSFFSSPYLL